MSALTVVQAGLFDTVQDLGRPGHAHEAVPHGGAADRLSLRVGNRLLGNDENAAAIECTALGGVFAFDTDALICLAGAMPSRATLKRPDGDALVEPLCPTPVPAHSELHVGGLSRGVRVLVCVAGGVLSEPSLGSRSMLVQSGIACHGRPLRAGDTLPIRTPPRGLRISRVSGPLGASVDAQIFRSTLRVTPGAHADLFGENSWNVILGSTFEVDARSNRAGVRLASVGVTVQAVPEQVSEATLPGAVQIPPSGLPVILGVEGPTTGGYPVIATVIEADLPSLAQLAPGDAVRFERVTRDEARTALLEQERLIASVPAPASHTSDTGVDL